MEHNQSEIAECISVHKSTSSRELCCNCGLRGYRPKQTHQKALTRRKGRQWRITKIDWKLVEEKLRLDWSPEQVSSWLSQNEGIEISHERIYQHIYADKRADGDLHTQLRCQKKRCKRYGRYERRGKNLHQVSLDQRPEIVKRRTRLGDWVGDLIISKSHGIAVVTLTERKSRFTLIRRVASKFADLVAQTVIELLKWVGSLETITTDSLIRKYLPKDRDLSAVTIEEEFFVMDRLNLRPRKCLDSRTSYELFFQHRPVALQS